MKLTCKSYSNLKKPTEGTLGLTKTVHQQEGDGKMGENKRITTGGIIFLCLVAIIGSAAALCGAWPFLYPPPNHQTFMDKINQLVMVGGGTAIAFGSLLVLAVKARK